MAVYVLPLHCLLQKQRETKDTEASSWHLCSCGLIVVSYAVVVQYVNESNGWQTTSQIYPAETGTVTRSAWETLVLSFCVFQVGLQFGWMSAYRCICEEPSCMVSPAGSSGICFNALFCRVRLFQGTRVTWKSHLRVCMECLVLSVKSRISAVNGVTWENMLMWGFSLPLECRS